MAQVELSITLKVRWWVAPLALVLALGVRLGVPLRVETATRLLMHGIVPVVT